MKGAVPSQTPALYAKFLKVELSEIVKLYRKERGDEEGTAPFIYGVISVLFKF